MKKVAVLGIILVLLAVSVVPVMAGNGHGNGNGNGQGNNSGNGVQTNQGKHGNIGIRGNGKQGKQKRAPFYLQGYITAVGSGTITVKLTHGNAQVKQYIGADLTIAITGTVQIYTLSQGEGSEGESEGMLAPSTTTGSGSASSSSATIGAGTVTSGENNNGTGLVGQPVIPNLVGVTITTAPAENDTDNDIKSGETSGERVLANATALQVGKYVAIHGYVLSTTVNSVVTPVFAARLITVYLNHAIGQPLYPKP